MRLEGRFAEAAPAAKPGIARERLVTKITCLLLYLAAISLISGIVTCYDKYAAVRRPAHRTPERVLLLLAALGGSAAMYLTMRCIRHKTRRLKFMAGLPVIFFLQVAAAGGIFLLFFR